jgi:hypothetical protein
MTVSIPASPTLAESLILSVIASSDAQLLLLGGDLEIIAASDSFGRAFHIETSNARGHPTFDLGSGEWDLPKLRSLLSATAAGRAAVDSYEMDLKRKHRETHSLVIKAQKLQYGDANVTRLLVTVSDVTDARAAEKLKDELMRERAILLEEVQHRVAKSLQIIASVLMQSARTVQSKETRTHLTDAHNRVMSIAARAAPARHLRQARCRTSPLFHPTLPEPRGLDDPRSWEAIDRGDGRP